MRGFGLIVFVALAAAAGPVGAADWDALAAPSPALKACLTEALGSENAEKLFALKGERPENKALRKRAKQALGDCGDAGAEGGQKSAAGCAAAKPYAGPLFDAMTQIDEKEDMVARVAAVRAAGVTKLAIFARSRKSLGPNEADVLDLRQHWPDFVVLGAPKYFLLRGDLDDDFIAATLSGIKEHDYAFVGEVLYTHGDKTHGETTGTGERQVDPARPGTAKLVAGLAGFARPLALMTHWEVYAWERDWPKFSALYASAPKQPFIVPHMGFGSIEQMRQVMSAHANVHLTTSKKEGDKGGYSDAEKAARLGDGMTDGCGRLKPKWRDFLVAYSGRIMFATDAHKTHRWRVYAALIERARAWLGDLPPDAAKAIAWDNAERLYLRRDP